MNRKYKLIVASVSLLIVAAAYFLVALGNKDGGITFEINWPVFISKRGESALADVIFSLRLPRVVAAVLTGSALAVAGLLLQGVTRNPLADPFLLGISGGAGMGVVIINAFPGIVSAAGWWIVPAVAFAGAQGATVLVMFLAKGSGRKVSVVGLVLSGVIVNAFFAAFTTFLIMQFEPLRMKVTSLWLAGGIGYFGWTQLAGSAVVIVLALFFIRFKATALNAFSLGEEGAALVGIDAQKTLEQAAWTASLLTGVAVSLGGLIGYIGLLVPHAVRMLIGRDFKYTLLMTAFFGALLLLIGDGAARTVMAPQEIPVGILAAIIGTPILLVLLKKELERKS